MTEQNAFNPYWQHFGTITQRHLRKQNPKISTPLSVVFVGFIFTNETREKEGASEVRFERVTVGVCKMNQVLCTYPVVGCGEHHGIRFSYDSVARLIGCGRFIDCGNLKRLKH